MNTAKETTLFDFTMNAIDGKEVPLKEYKGKVVMVVNVASKCGLTPQYEGLEKLYRDHKEKGFVVLGFPANDFMGQEPGTNEEIATFCKTKYDVSFPMFEKVAVKGEKKSPLYAWLLEQTKEPEDIQWNFEKFLIGRDGKIAARFSPKVKPDAPEIAAKLKELLGE
jgi:glutathione peroxidase